jgi:hypothetical protein
VHGHRAALGCLKDLGTILNMKVTKHVMVTMLRYLRVRPLLFLMMGHHNIPEKRMLCPQQQKVLHRSPLRT